MKIKNVFGNEYTGTIGKSITGSKWKGVRYIRKHFLPKNPRTQEQVVVRTRFTDAVREWKEMTLLQRMFYQFLCRGENMTGYNRYIKRRCKLHTMDMEQFLPIEGEIKVTDARDKPVADVKIAVYRTGTKKLVWLGKTGSDGVMPLAVTPYDENYDVVIGESVKGAEQVVTDRTADDVTELRVTVGA